MRTQRYVLTGVFAALIWPILMWAVNNPLFEILQYLPLVGLALMACLFLATIGGIWSADAWSSWSSGDVPLAGLRATLTRVTVAIFAAVIFCAPLSMALSTLLETEVSFGTTLRAEGFLAFAAVLFGVQIVDILVRNYKH